MSIKNILTLLATSYISLTAQTIVNVSYENKTTFPYYIGDTNTVDKQYPGLAIDALKELEKKYDIKFHFKREPGTRGQKKLQYNKTDLLLFASYKPSREKIGVYPKTPDGKVDNSRKTMMLSYVLYKKKGNPLDWDGEHFINLTGKIGATRGYSIVKFLKAKGVEVEENNNNFADIRKLLRNRLQGVANQESKIDYSLHNNPSIAKEIEKVKTPLKSKAYFMLFSHDFYTKHKKLAEQIWNELKDLDTNPKFKHLREKYYNQ